MIPFDDYNFEIVDSTLLLEPDQSGGAGFLEREEGGIAVSDPSIGLKGTNYTLLYNKQTGIFSVLNETTNVATSVTSAPEVIESSLAFDQNMRPVIAYQNNSGAYLYWYDPTIEEYRTTTLPEGSTTPRLTMDDKRDFATISNINDVILGYVRNDTVYIRIQRERYQNEYSVGSVPTNTRMQRMGLSRDNRLKMTFRYIA